MKRENLLEFNYPGTPERIEQLWAQCKADMAAIKNRPFINGADKTGFMKTFDGTWNINHIIALFNYANVGTTDEPKLQFLPDIYKAPEDIYRMLYPVQEYTNYQTTLGTIVIDREQYCPELKNLSYFVHMVDEELYEQMKDEQGFRGPNFPLFMYKRHSQDGVRVFKDYHTLAKYLSKKKFITYCIGPRSAFYLRLYLYQIETHIVQEDYAFGQRVDNSFAEEIQKHITRHVAFHKVQEFEHKFKLTVDNYAAIRVLAKTFQLNLKPIEEYNSTTMIQRFSKQTMHAAMIARIKNNKHEFYDQKLGIKPWNHLCIVDDMVIVYVWDSRNIEQIIPIIEFDQDDLTYNVNDNRLDLQAKDSLNDDAKAWLENHKNDIAVQFRYGVPDTEYDGSEDWHWRAKA